jgi:hypothetical protein
MISFNNDDSGYLSWIRDNRSGYVVNRKVNWLAENLIIHRANCRTLRKTGRNGWTTNGHIKACSNDKEKLVKWAKQNFGHTPLPCMNCKP